MLRLWRCKHDALPPWCFTGLARHCLNGVHAELYPQCAPLGSNLGCTGRAVLLPRAGGASQALRARAVSAPWALGHYFPRLPTLARPLPVAGTRRSGRAGCCRPDGLTATGVGECATQRLVDKQHAERRSHSAAQGAAGVNGGWRLRLG
jgi:hypothetical protein